MAPAFTLYMRMGCSLCEQMQYELEAYRGRLEADIDVVDIDADAALVARFGDKVPVLWGPDGEICHYFLDPQRLQRYFTNY